MNEVCSLVHLKTLHQRTVSRYFVGVSVWPVMRGEGAGGPNMPSMLYWLPHLYTITLTLLTNHLIFSSCASLSLGYLVTVARKASVNLDKRARHGCPNYPPSINPPAASLFITVAIIEFAHHDVAHGLLVSQSIFKANTPPWRSPLSLTLNRHQAIVSQTAPHFKFVSIHKLSAT